jgi:hypothetical protein
MCAHIREAYKNFTPAIDVAKVARLLLDHVPHEHLDGIEEVVLTNIEALSRERRRGGTTSGSRVDAMCALYHQPWNGRSARIEIFVDATLGRLPSFLWKFPFFRNFAFSEVLYHEIGHHMAFLQRCRSGDREGLAETHAATLFMRFFRKRYWYLQPLVLPLRWTYGFLAR